MLEMLTQWYRRRFSDPEAIALLAILVAGFCILFFLHGLLAPPLVAIVLAYLLEWPTSRLQRIGCSRGLAATLVLVLFIGIVLVMAFVVVPVAWQQGINLIRDIPGMLNKLSDFAATLPKRFPALMDAGIIDAIAENMRTRIITLGDSVVKYSLASLVGLLTLAIYLILVPLMVFFLVKDKEQLLNAVRRVLPRNRGLAGQVWVEMNQQITNYIRGKVLEMIVVGVATWIGFLIFGLNYSLLLAVL
ncbi:AI-2E family transporter, partial [Cronobacter sakazakii]